MADREPWEKNYNPEPWEKPDKPAPWLRKKTSKDQEPWERKADDTEPWDRPARSSGTVNNLRNAENNAVSGREPNYSTGDQDSYYTGKGKSKDDSQNKSGLRSKLKGKGALITIALILVGAGVFLSTSNSLLAPAISALMTMETQTSYTSYSLRVKHIMSGMMDESGGAVTTGWTGAKKYSKIPNYMKKRLAKFDIEVEGSGKNTILRWNGEDIDAASFVNKMNTDAEFRNAYMKAKRGRVATFFDNVADKIYQKLGISRNLFKDYKQTNDPDVDTANLDKTMSPKFDGDTTSLDTRTEGEKQEYDRDDKGNIIYDDDGNPKTHPVDDPGPSSNGSATSGSADPEVKAETMLKNVAESVGQVGTWACTAMRVGNMIAVAAAAQEVYQSINYFMGLAENISKMKYGEGDASAINAMLNFFTTSTTTQTTSDFGKLGVVTIAEGTQPKIDTVTETGAPVEASGMQKMLANAHVRAANTANYSLERIIKTLGGAATFGTKSTLVCAGVDFANSLLSIATSLVPGVGTVKVIAQSIYKLAKNVITTATVSAFLSFLIPTLTKVFFSNAFEVATGIPAGELFAQGGAAANMREGRSGSGQSISGKEEVIEFAHQTNVVLAQDAEIDRATLSPFDTSNPNTFFGSIAYSLLPTITSTNMTGLSSFLRSTATSLSSLMGGAFAEGEDSSYLTTYGDCPLLEEVGAVGDLYCNPIVTTDISTVDIEPTDSSYANAIEQNMTSCDDEGNCNIDPDENLAKYITYCDGRESPYGVVDQNILGELQTGSGTLGTIIDSTPLLGDIKGALNAVEDLNNVEWANGQKCGNTSANSEFWESEGKYYQRYVEDQRILEQMGAYEGSTNPVLALEEKYEKQQAEKYADTDPIVAYYSRISGLNIENTETMLAFVAYYNHVDQYDPTITIAMVDASEIDTSTEVIAKAMNEKINLEDNSDDINTPPTYIVLTDKYIAYADLRNRSYAA